MHRTEITVQRSLSPTTGQFVDSFEFQPLTQCEIHYALQREVCVRESNALARSRITQKMQQQQKTQPQTEPQTEPNRENFKRFQTIELLNLIVNNTIRANPVKHPRWPEQLEHYKD